MILSILILLARCLAFAFQLPRCWLPLCFLTYLPLILVTVASHPPLDLFARPVSTTPRATAASSARQASQAMQHVARLLTAAHALQYATHIQTSAISLWKTPPMEVRCCSVFVTA